MKAKIEEVAKKTRKLPKFQEKVDAAKVRSVSGLESFISSTSKQKDFTEYSGKIATLENEIKDLGDIDHLNGRRTELNDRMRANKTKIRNYQVSQPPFAPGFPLTICIEP